LVVTVTDAKTTVYRFTVADTTSTTNVTYGGSGSTAYAEKNLGSGTEKNGDRPWDGSSSNNIKLTTDNQGSVRLINPITVYVYDATNREWMGNNTTIGGVSATYIAATATIPGHYQLQGLGAGTYTITQNGEVALGYKANGSVTFTVEDVNGGSPKIIAGSVEGQAFSNANGLVLFVYNILDIQPGVIEITKTVDGTLYEAAHGPATFLFEVTDTETGQTWVRTITFGENDNKATVDVPDIKHTYTVTELKTARYAVDAPTTVTTTVTPGIPVNFTNGGEVKQVNFIPQTSPAKPTATVSFTNTKNNYQYLSDTDVVVNTFQAPVPPSGD
jgi:hypothetical protein